MNRSGVFICTLLLAVLSQGVSAAPVKKAEREAVGNGYDVEARAQQQQERFYRLWSKKVPVAIPAISVTLSPEESADLQNPKAGGLRKSPLELRQQVGLVKSVSHPVDFRDFRADQLPASPMPAAKGALASHAGGATWTASIDAGDATALRLHFTAFKLPSNAQLYIYNDEGQVDGPYNGSGSKGDGSFWSHTIAGGTAYVQVEFDGQPSTEDLRGAHFVIADVAYIGPSFQAIALWSTCRSNASCVIRDDGSNNAGIVGVARKAVAHMQFVSGGRVYICSGGLLADTDTNTERNYFLTANHCIGTTSEADSLETFFLYTECGTGSAPAATIGVGAQILASGSSSDFTLLELNGTVPAEAMRLGWNANEVHESHGLPLYRISHPNGAPQSYSEHTVNTGGPTCGSWPRGPRIYSHDIVGATEGGSSGSPVLDSSGDVVGQLSGACGYNPSDSCDDTNATVDGALAAYFPQVGQWLAPTEPEPGGNQAPTASFRYACTEKACTFTDQSTDPDAGDFVDSWSWDFGDSSGSSDEQPPEHTYANQGNYTVTLTVTDSHGATGTVSATFRIKKRGTVSGSVGGSDGGGSDPVETVEAERGKKKCNDGKDNDGDTLIDDADPDCQ